MSDIFLPLYGSGSDGSTLNMRVFQRLGYGGKKVAENVAGGYDNALSLVGGWMCSASHRRTLMVRNNLALLGVCELLREHSHFTANLQKTASCSRLPQHVAVHNTLNMILMSLATNAWLAAY